MPKASKPSPLTTTARNRSATPTAPTQGRADLARLRRTTEAELTRTTLASLRDLPADAWQGVRVVTSVAKESISIRLEQDVIAFFRSKNHSTSPESMR